MTSTEDYWIEGALAAEFARISTRVDLAHLDDAAVAVRAVEMFHREYYEVELPEEFSPGAIDHDIRRYLLPLIQDSALTEAVVAQVIDDVRRQVNFELSEHVTDTPFGIQDGKMHDAHNGGWDSADPYPDYLIQAGVNRWAQAAEDPRFARSTLREVVGQVDVDSILTWNLRFPQPAYHLLGSISERPSLIPPGTTTLTAEQLPSASVNTWLVEALEREYQSIQDEWPDVPGELPPKVQDRDAAVSWFHSQHLTQLGPNVINGWWRTVELPEEFSLESIDEDVRRRLTPAIEKFQMTEDEVRRIVYCWSDAVDLALLRHLSEADTGLTVRLGTDWTSRPLLRDGHDLARPKPGVDPAVAVEESKARWARACKAPELDLDRLRRVAGSGNLQELTEGVLGSRLQAAQTPTGTAPRRPSLVPPIGEVTRQLTTLWRAPVVVTDAQAPSEPGVEPGTRTRSRRALEAGRAMLDRVGLASDTQDHVTRTARPALLPPGLASPRPEDRATPSSGRTAPGPGLSL